MDDIIAAQQRTAAAAGETIVALEEGIATAERMIREMAMTQEFLDSVRPRRPVLTAMLPLVAAVFIDG